MVFLIVLLVVILIIAFASIKIVKSLTTRNTIPAAKMAPKIGKPTSSKIKKRIKVIMRDLLYF